MVVGRMIQRSANPWRTGAHRGENRLLVDGERRVDVNGEIWGYDDAKALPLIPVEPVFNPA